MLPKNCAQQRAVPAKSESGICLFIGVLCVFVVVFLASPTFAQDQQDPAGADAQDEQAETVPNRPLDILPGMTGGGLDELRALNPEEATEENSTDLGISEQSAKPFRIGLIPRGDTSRYLKRLQGMRTGLGDLLGRPVEILAMETFSAMIDAQTLRRIDLAFYSSSAFVMADQLCRCVEPLIVPLAGDGTAAFHAIIAASSKSGIRNVSDLNGKRIVASSPDSIGGYRMQMASLISEGLDVDVHFGDVQFVGSGSEALRMVRSGQADAAFSWSSMSGNQANGYTRGPLSRLVQQGEVVMDEFVIVWQSKPIAHAPVAILKSLPASDRNAAKTYLMALPESDPETYDLLDAYYGGGYREADPTDFRPISVLTDVRINTPNLNAPNMNALNTNTPNINAPNSVVSAPAPASEPASAPEDEVAVDVERTVAIPRERPEPPAFLFPQ